MTATLFHTTRHIGQYFKPLTAFRGLKYIVHSGRTAQLAQDNLLNEESNPPPDLLYDYRAEDHATTATPKFRLFDLPKGFKPTLLRRPEYIEKTLGPLVNIIEQDPVASLDLSMDAEWNIRRRLGVSVIQLCPHTDPTVVYVISVHQLSSLPPSLIRLLTSKRVWKIGSRIKGDLTRLRKQFPNQLDDSVQFSTIELKDYALAKGFIKPKQMGSLASLCESVLGMYLPKDSKIRANNNWEFPTISSSLLHYAACDVLASRMIFERISGGKGNYFVPRETELEQDDVRDVQVQVLQTDPDAELLHVRV